MGLPAYDYRALVADIELVKTDMVNMVSDLEHDLKQLRVRVLKNDFLNNMGAFQSRLSMLSSRIDTLATLQRMKRSLDGDK